eukprot:m.1489333 g.1489333  ORF g.1489333 m.1489333 type:complete len:123 (-) comp25189_c0_seq57:255-623(-)
MLFGVRVGDGRRNDPQRKSTKFPGSVHTASSGTAPVSKHSWGLRGFDANDRISEGDQDFEESFRGEVYDNMDGESKCIHSSSLRILNPVCPYMPSRVCTLAEHWCMTAVLKYHFYVHRKEIS